MRHLHAQFVTPLAVALAACILTGCGGVPNTSLRENQCGGCNFFYATSVSGSILEENFSAGQQAWTAPVLTLGPANSRGIAAVWQIGQAADLYVSDPENNAIRVYRISHADGSLSPSGLGPYALSGTGEPQQILVANGDLFVASTAGEVFGFKVQADGSLTPLPGSPFASGAGTTHLCASGGTTLTFYLYASNSSDPNGSISAFAVHTDGTVTPVPGSPFATVADGQPEGLFSTGGRVYAALSHAGEVAAFSIASDGSLQPIAGSPYPAEAGASSLTQVGQYLYSENTGNMSGYSIDSSSGALTALTASPFAAANATGEMNWIGNWVLVPESSPGGFLAFLWSSKGNLSPAPGSPFPAGTTPLVAYYLQVEGVI